MPTTLTKTITAYKFQELSDTAKSTACHDLLPDYEWWDDIYAQAKENARSQCFRVDEIQFSGFHSQGDGACWTGRVYIDEWLEKHKPTDAFAQIVLALMDDDWIERTVEVYKSPSRYAHSHTMRVNDIRIYHPVDYDDTVKTGILKGAVVIELLQELECMHFIEDIRIEMQDQARAYADDIYHKLEKEYDYLCSEEHVAELCDMNDYLFDENGKLI